MMKSWIPVLWVAPIVFLFLNCAKPESPQGGETFLPKETVQPTVVVPSTPIVSHAPLAAEWDGGKIDLAQIDQILGPRKAQIIQSASDPVRVYEILSTERKKILDTLVENYLLIQEAHSRHLTLTNAEKDELLKNLRANYETEQAYKDSLAKSGQSESSVVEVLTNIRLGQLCVEDQRQKIQATLNDAALRAYYDQHVADKFTPPACSKVNWVVLQTKENRTLEESHALAVQLHDSVAERIKNATSLEAKRKVIQRCAYENSDDYSGKYNYGYVILYHWGPEYENYSQAFRDELSKRNTSGELSDVVGVKENSYGFFLLLEKTPAVVSPFDSPEVQSILPNMVLQEKLEQWRQDLKKRYNLKIYTENLSLLKPGSSSESSFAVSP